MLYGDLMICANPECQKEFTPKSQYARHQIYCSKSCQMRGTNLKWGCPVKTPEQLKRIEEIASRQQDFANPLVLKDSCEVCGSKESLCIHEVRYQPLEFITLCSSCHGILHHRFLKDRKVKPHYENGNVYPTVTKTIA